MSDWAVVVSSLCLIAILGFGIFGIPFIVQNRTISHQACVQGGYGGHVRFAGENLCLGVIDSAWQVEPLVDVQARMEER